MIMLAVRNARVFSCQRFSRDSRFSCNKRGIALGEGDERYIFFGVNLFIIYGAQMRVYPSTPMYDYTAAAYYYYKVYVNYIILHVMQTRYGSIELDLNTTRCHYVILYYIRT